MPPVMVAVLDGEVGAHAAAGAGGEDDGGAPLAGGVDGGGRGGVAQDVHVGDDGIRRSG